MLMSIVKHSLRISKACVVDNSECQFNLFRLRLLQIDSVVVVRIVDDDAPRPLAGDCTSLSVIMYSYS